MVFIVRAAAVLTAILFSVSSHGAASRAAGAAQSGVQKFFADVMIQSAFDNALRRSPDEQELRRYRVRVFEDHWSQADIEEDLRERSDYWTHDDRQKRQSSYDVDRMIEHAYEDILGRKPDDAGMRTYRSNVIDRGWTERQVRDALRKSPEYKTKSSEAADRTVDHAYKEVFGREPDANGRYSYRNQVQNHGWDEHDVEQALRNSPEYREKNKLSEADAREIVRRAYLSVLGREPDSGSAGYVREVLENHWGEREVARELRNSAEYREKQR